MRVGLGYDSHRLVKGRRLVLGGVEIPHEMGLMGHSDADALVHAVCDALLGALAAGDIGRHFPDSDPAFRDISSLILLERVVKLVDEYGYGVMNLDATVILEAPRLAGYIAAMSLNLSKYLKLTVHDISIKAKTNEGMGFIGRREGIAALAVVTIRKKEKE